MSIGLISDDRCDYSVCTKIKLNGIKRWTNIEELKPSNVFIDHFKISIDLVGQVKIVIGKYASKLLFHVMSPIID